MPKILEKSEAGPFKYERLSFDSKVLGQEARFGRLRFSDREPRSVLYFLHGGIGDDLQFVDAQLFQLIQGPLLEQFKEKAIEIILPGIGTSFLHGRHGESFANETMALAESGRSAPGRRVIAGLSMG